MSSAVKVLTRAISDPFGYGLDPRSITETFTGADWMDEKPAASASPPPSSYKPEEAPAPPAPAVKAEEVKEKATATATDEKATRKRRSILTGPQGLLSPAPTVKKKLLGE